MVGRGAMGWGVVSGCDGDGCAGEVCAGGI